MCVVSAILDHTHRWNPPILPAPWTPPYVPYVAPRRWTIEEMRDFLKLIEQAKEADRKAKLPDCEDPAKGRLIDAVRKSIDLIEGSTHV